MKRQFFSILMILFAGLPCFSEELAIGDSVQTIIEHEGGPRFGTLVRSRDGRYNFSYEFFHSRSNRSIRNHSYVKSFLR